MDITSGTRLGPYEILSFIGAGGMGEVYKARDTRLGRDVALKVLPASFAADADRLRRFEQEARAIAALSHPNILAVHDIGDYQGAPFLVSEFLDGESLRDVIARGPLSHRRSIDYATQIAHGLAAAHSKDIAHRDLKPDNIFITREGRVKILDFGLAKSVQKPVSGGHDGGGATMTAVAPATDIGTVMGTAGYMSPEQVRGLTVDARTDIFSFGAVLYEMLSGQRAFKRETAADTMAAILNDEPLEFVETGRQIPPVLDRIVRHCLEKAPEQRFQSARDLAFDLESITSVTASGGLSAAKVKERRRWWYAALLAALVAAAGIVGWNLSTAMRPVSGSKFHQVTYRRGTLGPARFSADGHNIIYTAAWGDGAPELYTVPTDNIGGHALGIQNAKLLAVSSHGEIAVALNPTTVDTFVIPGTLARTTEASGAPKPEIENVTAADFTPDGSELAIVRWVPADRKCQLEYPIGKVLFREDSIDNLRFSPDGKYLAFIKHENPGDDRGNAVILRKTGEKVAISQTFESVQGLAWNASGDEVWTTSPLESGDVHALSLSGKERTTLAVPGRLRLDDIAKNGELLVEQGIARRGMVVANGNNVQDLSWLDFGYLRDISRDGKMILFEEEGTESENYRIFLRNVDGSPAVPLGEGYGVAISPDKRWALGQKLGNPDELWLLPVGPGEPKRLSPPSLLPLVQASFLPDSQHVVFVAKEGNHHPRSWIVDINGGAPRAITPEGTFGSAVSPDGKWLGAVRLVGNDASVVEPVLVAMDTGDTTSMKGLKPEDRLLGWTSDGEIYVGSAVNNARSSMRVDKFNPHTGARVPWREISLTPIGGIFPDPPIITQDGSTFGFDYRMRLSDLYTVTGVR